MTYPQEVTHKHREANGQGGRTHAPVPSLVRHGEDADNQLQREEHLHGSGHAQADTRLQLHDRTRVREKQETEAMERAAQIPSAVLCFQRKSYVRELFPGKLMSQKH